MAIRYRLPEGGVFFNNLSLQGGCYYTFLKVVIFHIFQQLSKKNSEGHRPITTKEASKGFAFSFTSVDKSLFKCYASVDICVRPSNTLGSNIDFLPLWDSEQVSIQDGAIRGQYGGGIEGKELLTR